jgi:hypothetical protein
MGFSISKIRQLADGADPNSLSNTLRTKRFHLFESLVASLPPPVRLLDVGGTNQFWEQRGWSARGDIEIVTLNLTAEEQLHKNIKPVAGDATDLGEFGEGSFDIVFSNSVIEHLFTLANQRKMASEIGRVGKAFWVQTPNFWFPMEPHFHIPGWQWMPFSMRVAMIRRWKCGWRGPCADPERAKELVKEVRLMEGSELRDAFPGATVVPERFCGLVKSWIVIRGFPSMPQRL